MPDFSRCCAACQIFYAANCRSRNVLCSAQQSLSKAHSLLAHVPYKAAKLCTGNFLAEPPSNSNRVLYKVCPRQIFCRPCNSGSVLPYRTAFQQSDYSTGSLCLLNAAKQRTRCLCHPSRRLRSKQLFVVPHSKDATKDSVLHSLPEARIAARRNSTVCQLCSKFCSLPQIASFSCTRHALLYKPHRACRPACKLRCAGYHLQDLRCKPHSCPCRADTRNGRSYLIAIIQQILDYLPYAFCNIRQSGAEVIQLFDAKPGYIFQHRKEIVSNLNANGPPCAPKHRQYRFRGFAFQHKLLIHTASVLRRIAHIVQCIYEQLKISGQLRTALNGPLTEQSFQIAYLLVFRLSTDSGKQTFQCRRGVLLHILCKLFRSKSQLFKSRRLCICSF